MYIDLRQPFRCTHHVFVIGILSDLSSTNWSNYDFIFRKPIKIYPDWKESTVGEESQIWEKNNFYTFT